MKNKKIKVGLIGCGIVGSGLVNLINNNKSRIIELKTVVVKNTKKPRKAGMPNLSGKVEDIIEDPEIDIVVELIGGLNPAKDYIIRAIRNGKHVVTANKSLISEYGSLIFKEAGRYNVNVGFEGAVGGGIPIINPLLEQLKLGKINKISGILNGTTNFILTRMSEGMDYQSALKIAQKKGFAESNPDFDVKGLDAAQKISILASLAFGKIFKPNEVFCSGITEITPIDIEYAKELGYNIKLLAAAEKTSNGKVDIKVHPALLNRNHRLAGVNEEFNAILIEGEPFDEYFIAGKGAGRGPTAFSVFYDIIKIAQMIRTRTTRRILINQAGTKIADQDKIETEGYLRIYLRHIPGSAHRVFGILAEHGWNVKDSIQRSNRRYEIKSEGIKYLPYIITHEPLSFAAIKDSLTSLMRLEEEGSKIIHGNPFYMRIDKSIK